MECRLLLLVLMMRAIVRLDLRVLPDAKASYAAAGTYIEAELFMHYCVDISVPSFDILPVG
jgi:hypothetical protein